jgi:hypothetical protein
MKINLEIARDILELNCDKKNVFSIKKTYIDFGAKIIKDNIIYTNEKNKVFGGCQLFRLDELQEIENYTYSIEELEKKIDVLNNI